MAIICGRIVKTPDQNKPYKVVLEHERDGVLEYPVSTIREGEALIRETCEFRIERPKLDGWHL